MSRLKRVRDEMRGRDIDQLIVTTPADLRWLTGFKTPGAPPVHVGIVAHDSIKIVTRELEISNVQNREVVACAYSENEDAVERVVENVGSGTVAIDGTGINGCVLLDFLNALPELVVLNGSIIAPIRAIKDGAELRAMAKAATSATVACNEVTASVMNRKLRTEGDIVAEVFASFARSETNQAVYPIFVHAGRNGVLGHCAAESTRKLEEGTLVMIEIGTSYEGYHAAKMHTMFLGPRIRMHQCIQEAEEAVMQALAAMCKSAFHGNHARQVANVGLTLLRRCKGWTPCQRLGYSIGCAQGCVDWGEAHVISISSESPHVLKEGHTLHMIPHMKHAEFGCIGFSKTVVIGKVYACDLSYTVPGKGITTYI